MYKMDNVRKDIEEIEKIMNNLNPKSLEYWNFMLIRRQLQVAYNSNLRESEKYFYEKK